MNMIPVSSPAASEPLPTLALVAQQITAADEAATIGLTTGGTLVMVVSIGCVLTMLAYCLWKVFTLPPAE